ncbi:MAG: ABC transporter substrate-binding protein [Ardenticatenales bacterium]|nr:ABC transporter substrate-binding protein [Ardenticatenales bacterium]
MRHPFTRRQILRAGAATSLLPFVAACASQATPEVNNAPQTELLASGNSIPLDSLIPEARKEGLLSTMTLPHDWANYGKIIETYREKYLIAINEINPPGSSQDEVDAIKAHQEDKGPLAPDVVDMGLGFAESSKAEGLFAPYKVATWDTIPEGLKDPEGHWYCSYYGVFAFEVNREVVKNVPRDWSDLLKPEYKGMVALGGDPTRSSMATNSVWAAGLSQTDSLDDAPEAGMEFFAELHKVGNLVPTIGLPSTVANGQTPILIFWDFLALGDRDKSAGTTDIEVVVPESGVFGVPSIQAISAYAPHPFAARLWEEFLYSDEGQLLWLEGYAHPIRYNDLVKNNKVPAELAARLPAAELYARAVFPTSAAQTDQAKKLINEGWVSKVGVEIK